MNRETIYDHNVTEAELALLFPSVITKEDHLLDGGSLNTEWGHIFRLYDLRNNAPKAEEYLQKITNERYKFNLKSCDTDH